MNASASVVRKPPCKECLRRGLKEDEFVVRSIEEEMPEEIDEFNWDVEEEIYED